MSHTRHSKLFYKPGLFGGITFENLKKEKERKRETDRQVVGV
jgi:hypothetical protein